MKSRVSRARLAVLPLACAAACPVLAQSTSTLSETVVTATRVEQPLTDVVADVSIIDRAAIERSGASALADLLARQPGVSTTHTGGPASTTSVYLRGGESRFTAVFVNGVRVDSQSTGGATWNAIPLSQVERIEVLRGPAAAIYGSDALTGVIQIFTREGAVGLKPSLELGLGSHGTERVDLGLSGGQGAWTYALGATRDTSDGFNAKPSGTPDRDGYRLTAASARVGWTPVAGHQLEATWLSNDLKAQYDGFTSGKDDWALHELQTLGLTWQARWSDLYTTRVSVSESNDRYETKPSPYVTDTTLQNYLWQNEWRQGASLITAALERREDHLNNASTTPSQTRRSQNALALGYGLKSGAHTLQLNARHDDDSEFGGQATGSAAYAYGFAPNWRATASAGTAFRAPTLFQRFSIYGVPTLKPETSRNVELGVKYEAHGFSASVVAYRNRLRDLIDYVSGPGSCANGTGAYAGCYANVNAARYEGLTFQVGSRLDNGLQLGASLDLLDPKNLVTGKQLPRRAKQMATLTADLALGTWSLGSELQLVGERYDNASNTARLAGYGLLNLSASARLAPDWTLVGRIDNVGDKDYQTALGYATAGRVVYLGLKWAAQ